MIAPSVSMPVEAVPQQLNVPSIRLATEDDRQFVEDLQALAFGPGRFARTAFRIRERFPIDESLSLIAEVGGVRCGSVWMTPISVGGVDGYLLGPLATHPDFRRRGAGKMLAKEVTRIALERGEGSFVLLVGDQDYYCPLGWVPTVRGSIRFPGPVDPHRVLLYAYDPLLAERLSGQIAAFGAQNRA
jgi:predicted N-acetyltransferase YhbS